MHFLSTEDNIFPLNYFFIFRVTNLERNNFHRVLSRFIKKGLIRALIVEIMLASSLSQSHETSMLII